MEDAALLRDAISRYEYLPAIAQNSNENPLPNQICEESSVTSLQPKAIASIPLKRRIEDVLGDVAFNLVCL
ncbi:MAG: hypothetical protein Fur0046_00540 [Cyanobacteria bacterium J069]